MSARGIWERLNDRGWKLVREWVDEFEGESMHLDFKRGLLTDNGRLHGDTLNALSRAVSGFANSDGGVLLFGIATARVYDEPEHAQHIDPIKPLKQFHARMLDVLRDAVEPPHSAVRLLPIEDPDKSEQGVLVVYVPPSDGGPHRALRGDAKHRYLVRGENGFDTMSHSALAAMFGKPPRAALHLRMVREKDTLAIEVHNVGRGVAHGLGAPANGGSDEERIWHRAHIEPALVPAGLPSGVQGQCVGRANPRCSAHRLRWGAAGEHRRADPCPVGRTDLQASPRPGSRLMARPHTGAALQTKDGGWQPIASVGGASHGGHEP